MLAIFRSSYLWKGMVEAADESEEEITGRLKVIANKILDGILMKKV